MLSYHYLGLPTIRVVYANANESKKNSPSLSVDHLPAYYLANIF